MKNIEEFSKKLRDLIVANPQLPIMVKGSEDSYIDKDVVYHDDIYKNATVYVGRYISWKPSKSQSPYYETLKDRTFIFADDRSVAEVLELENPDIMEEGESYEEFLKKIPGFLKEHEDLMKSEWKDAIIIDIS